MVYLGIRKMFSKFGGYSRKKKMCLERKIEFELGRIFVVI